MSNYTGGGRNHAKHRSREPGSRAPFATKNPFTSNGLAVTRVPERHNTPMVPNFNLKHAKNALDKPVVDRGPVQVGKSRIDAVPSDFIPKNFIVATQKTPPKSTLEALAELDDPRSRVLKRLNQPSFIGLPPLKTRKPASSILKRRWDDISPICSPPTQPIKRPKPTLFPALLQPPINTETIDYDAPNPAAEDNTDETYQVGEHEGMETRNEQDNEPMTPRPFQRDPADMEDIFSWSPDLLERHREDCDFIHSDEDDVFIPNETPLSNPFLTNRASDSTLVDQAEDTPFTHSHFAEEYEHLGQEAKPPEGNKVLAVALPETWLLSPTMPMERLRLAGDRSGVGLPLKRWVGDGLELAHGEGLFPTVYHLDSDEEDESKYSSALSWLDRPYEDHLVEVHDVMEHDDQADLATATPAPDTKDAEDSSEEQWIHDFAGGEELVDAESPSEQSEGNVGMSGATQTTPMIPASPEEELYGWELEDDVVQVVPIPVQDEEVFILAPTLFDFDD